MTVKINYEYIESLRFLEKTTEEKILDNLLLIFEEQYKGISYEILSHIHRNEYYEASSLAHKLKSSALQLGMETVAQRCLFLETECKKKNSHDYKQVVDSLFTEAEESLKMIIHYIQSNNSVAA